MEKIKLCIFDMDGLLIDTERRIWSVAEKAIGKDMGIEVTDRFINSIIGSGSALVKKRLRDEFGQDFPAEEYLDRLYDYYEYVCNNETVPVKKGVFELLNFLKENNIHISIGSSTRRALARKVLKKCGLYDYFEFSVFGDEVKDGKPKPEIYMNSVVHFNLKPEECIVFEDSDIGAMSAYSANINLVFVEDLKKPTEQEYKKAFAILKSIDEIIPVIKKINNINS